MYSYTVMGDNSLILTYKHKDLAKISDKIVEYRGEVPHEDRESMNLINGFEKEQNDIIHDLISMVAANNTKMLHIIFSDDYAYLAAPTIYMNIKQAENSLFPEFIKNLDIGFHVANTDVIIQLASFEPIKGIKLICDSDFFIKNSKGKYNHYTLDDAGLSIRSIEYDLSKRYIHVKT